MIITITDHCDQAIEQLAGTGSGTTTLHQRLITDDCQQPASFIAVDRHTMNEILVELAKRGHVAITPGGVS